MHEFATGGAYSAPPDPLAKLMTRCFATQEVKSNPPLEVFRSVCSAFDDSNNSISSVICVAALYGSVVADAITGLINTRQMLQ